MNLPSLHSSAALILCCAIGSAQAQTAAYGGIAADGVSTAIGLARGGIELNPLGFATIPLRIVAVEYAKTLPREQGQRIFDMAEAVGFGAAAFNLIAPGIGLVVGLALWQRRSAEREFLNACALHKRALPETSDLPCVMTARSDQ